MGLFDSVAQAYDDLWLNLVRPERTTVSDEQLSPEYFSVGEDTSLMVKRIGIDVMHEKTRLKATLFVPVTSQELSLGQELFPRPPQENACFIFLHSQSANRAEGRFLVDFLCPHGISVMLFDFGGSGSSSEKYITLGLRESEELKAVVDKLKDEYSYDRIGLWGKSMGAVTALFYGQRSATIDVMVLDSPFDKIESVIYKVADQQSSMPRFVISGVMHMIRNTIMKEVGFDIYQVDPSSIAHRVTVPACFLVGTKDSMINIDDFMKLYNAYAGEKKLTVIADASHADCRSSDSKVMREIIQFIIKQLGDIRNSLCDVNPYNLGGPVLSTHCEKISKPSPAHKSPTSEKKISLVKQPVSKPVELGINHLRRAAIHETHLSQKLNGHEFKYSHLKLNARLERPSSCYDLDATLSRCMTFGHITPKGISNNLRRELVRPVQSITPSTIHNTHQSRQRVNEATELIGANLTQKNFNLRSFIQTTKHRPEPATHPIKSFNVLDNQVQQPSVTGNLQDSSMLLKTRPQSRLMLKSQSIDISHKTGKEESITRNPLIQTNLLMDRVGLLNGQAHFKKDQDKFSKTQDVSSGIRNHFDRQQPIRGLSFFYTDDANNSKNGGIFTEEPSQEMPSFIWSPNAQLNKTINDSKLDRTLDYKLRDDSPLSRMSDKDHSVLPQSFKMIPNDRLTKDRSINPEIKSNTERLDETRQETNASFTSKTQKNITLTLRKNSLQQKPSFDGPKTSCATSQNRHLSVRMPAPLLDQFVSSNPLNFSLKGRSQSLRYNDKPG